MKKLLVGILTLAMLLLVGLAAADTLSEDGWLYTVTRDGTVTLLGYEGEETKLVLPETLGGQTVTAIGGNAFKGQVAIKSLTIPDNYVSIGAYAFQDCTRIAELTIGSGIQEWKADWGTNAAFRGCVNLFEVHFAEGITEIGAYAFDGCTLLDEVNLPSTVVTVGKGAFRNCELLDIANVYGSVEDSAFENCTYLSQLTLHNATSIGDKAFLNCSSLKTLTLPESLVSLGAEAFRDCTKLRELILPEALATVGYRALFNCKQLTKLTLGGRIANWTKDWGESKAFAECPMLSSVTLAPGIEALPQGAFYNCDSLAEIALPDGLLTIESSAFENCDALTSVSFPTSVRRIEAGAFKNCNVLRDYILPADLEYIGSEAFRATAVSEINIPSKVVTIGHDAFRSSPDLQKVTLGESVTNWENDWGENRAFADCSALQVLEIENGVNSIGSYAFQNCVSLMHVEVPASVVSLGVGAFKNCTALQSAIVYRGEIGDSAFDGDSALTSVQIRKVTSIGSNAFRSCVNLQEIELPRTLISLGRRAFQFCAALHHVELPESLTEIDALVFEDCTGLESVIIGNNIGEWKTEWGNSAIFKGCTALKWVYVEDLSTVLGGLCFQNCTSLEAVYLPATLLNIPEDILKDASASVVIYGETGSAAESFAAAHEYAFSTEAFPYDLFNLSLKKD